MKENLLGVGMVLLSVAIRRQLPEDFSYRLIQNEKNPLIERVLKFLLTRLNYRAITLAAEGPLAPLVISNSTR
ncbi:hypothetical protein ACVXG7_08375 [Enterobacter hormaechei]